MSFDQKFNKDKIREKVEIWLSQRTATELYINEICTKFEMLIGCQTPYKFNKDEIIVEFDIWLGHRTAQEFIFKSGYDNFSIMPVVVK